MTITTFGKEVRTTKGAPSNVGLALSTAISAAYLGITQTTKAGKY